MALSTGARPCLPQLGSRGARRLAVGGGARAPGRRIRNAQHLADTVLQPAYLAVPLQEVDLWT
jgi:hypothetical protein